jgi:hypothetical protein
LLQHTVSARICVAFSFVFVVLSHRFRSRGRLRSGCCNFASTLCKYASVRDCVRCLPFTVFSHHISSQKWVLSLHYSYIYVLLSKGYGMHDLSTRILVGSAATAVTIVTFICDSLLCCSLGSAATAIAIVTFICVSFFVSLRRWCDCYFDVHVCSPHSALAHFMIDL